MYSHSHPGLGQSGQWVDPIRRLTSPHVPCMQRDIFSRWVGASNTPRMLREFLVSVCPEEYSHIRSRSIRRTLLPCSTKAPERQTAVVVFPIPPLWFTTATVFT